MLDMSPDRSSDFHSDIDSFPPSFRFPEDRWQQLAASAILVLGSPRSGTSWLAKIFDSHPNILYRHEPDEMTLPQQGLNPAQQIAEWIWQRALRVAVKRPNFQKSWRPPARDTTRTLLVTALAGAQRLRPLYNAASRIGVPDLIAPDRWDRSARQSS